ncbi:hypothetical protein C8N46_104290 [Kordia periserrulae]|uniref:Uncharacterized protein n=1 Tax=Kordia periserrulae TaxID=701523 RepID=A0A2T6C014_9FLAO|nr:hypothetical protein [Kordia periserrulae]PTX61646.1 hypothetical protein C8N46_104290 [Kordia periserrulae]
MNIKTIFTSIVCFIIFSMNAQVDINEKAATIKLSPSFTKGMELKYDVKKSIFVEEADTISYQLNILFKDIKDDTANLSVFYTNLKNGNSLTELFEDVIVDIDYHLTNQTFTLSNEKKLQRKLKKILNKNYKNNDIASIKALTEIVNSLHNQGNPIENIFVNDIEQLSMYYQKTIPYNRSVSDSLKVDEPIPQSTQILKYGMYKQDNGDYNFKYNKEVLTDGLRKLIEAETEKAYREEVGADSLSVVEFTIDKDIKMEMTSEENILYDGESCLIKSYTFTDRVVAFGSKLLDTFKSMTRVE